jgi:hypothetical protein
MMKLVDMLLVYLNATSQFHDIRIHKLCEAVSYIISMGSTQNV